MEVEPPTPQRKPEAGDGADAEDIPSDFFDDFNKADFIEGLSVIDSWDDKEKAPQGDRSRFNAKTVDSVKDLRELMSEDRSKEDTSHDDRRSNRKNESPKSRQSASNSRLDEFIKPGSRRDPNKTNEAIKRDKEEKVKEFLAKSLESSSDDLRPPGTELDDYYESSKTDKKQAARSRSRDRRDRQESPRKPSRRTPPKWSPRRSPPSRRRSPLVRRRRSPQRSPKRSPRRSPRRSPQRSRPFHRAFVEHKRFSPVRRGSPRRYSPRRSPRTLRRSRSRSPYRRPRRSRSPANRDDFLYPTESDRHNYPPYQAPPQYGPPSDYPSGPPGYPYPPTYTGGYAPQYDYAGMPASQPIPPPIVPSPIPNPAAVPLPVPNPIAPPTGHIPAMVPAPTMMAISPLPMKPEVKTPYDALAKLVAEGKISKEDYMKLAPNKGPISSADEKNKLMVLNRCTSALIKLKTLELPNKLLFNQGLKLGAEPHYIAPKFCSPLKRQAPVEFQFTTSNGSTSSQQNKLLIDSIIAAVGLEKVIARPRKKTPKNMKDAAVQTSKPFCDICEIRAATTTSVGITTTDPEYFSASVHTQVVEQDLVNSKAVFNPSGSVGDASMSIAHLTPAQLVSQLAARAKTLKKPESAPSQYRRQEYDDYDYNRGGQYQNYSNDGRGQYQNYNDDNRGGYNY